MEDMPVITAAFRLAPWPLSLPRPPSRAGIALAKLNITKHEQDGHRYYEGWQHPLFDTAVARLHGVTPRGRAFLARSGEYCRMERASAARLLAGRPLSKPGLQREFGFPGRIVNTAITHATAQLKSQRECAALNREDATEAIGRKLFDYWEASETPLARSELSGRRRHLAKLVEREAAAEQAVEHPAFFPGRHLFRQQSVLGPQWRAAYEAARSDHIGCVGSADEASGNSTLEVGLGVAEIIKGHAWQWIEVWHARVKLASARLRADEDKDLIAILQQNAAPKETAIVEGWVDADGKDIHPKRVEAMQKRNERPVATRPVRRAVKTGRVALTVMFRRQASGRWYLHLSHVKQNLPKVFAPVGWMGVDLNVDSIAHACLSDTQDLLSYGKDYFPPSGPKGIKEEDLFAIVNRLVAEAKERRLGMSLEFLQFEGSKRWLKNKLGALLRVFPYRRIRAIFEARCRVAGVPLRFVPPSYSSLIGGLVAVRWTHLGRDQAAAAVIAARATVAGDAWLERLCRAAAQAERFTLRLNAKGLFGHNVTVTASSPAPEVKVGHQRDHPTTPGIMLPLRWQPRCGREISVVSSTARRHYLQVLRAKRRAAEAPGRSPSLPRPEVPTLFSLDRTGAYPLVLKFEQE